MDQKDLSFGEFLKKKAETFTDHVWLWKRTSQISFERGVNWSLVKGRTESLRQCDCLCSIVDKFGLENEKEEAALLLKEKKEFTQ